MDGTKCSTSYLFFHLISGLTFHYFLVGDFRLFVLYLFYCLFLLKWASVKGIRRLGCFLRMERRHCLFCARVRTMMMQTIRSFWRFCRESTVFRIGLAHNRLDNDRFFGLFVGIAWLVANFLVICKGLFINFLEEIEMVGADPANGGLISRTNVLLYLEFITAVHVLTII